MNTLNLLAELWGFGFLALGLSLLINPNNRKEIFKAVEDDMGLFCVGMITLVLAIATLLNYHVWSGGWGLVITIIGWLGIVKGIFLLFLPSTAKKMYSKMANKDWMTYLYFVAVILGLFLIYMGFKV